MNRSPLQAAKSRLELIREQPLQASLVTFLVLLFLWSYWPTMGRIFHTWQSDPDYSHGFLVVPIAIAVWMRRRPHDDLPRIRPAVGGLFLIALASLLRMVAAKYYILPLDAWSIPLWIAGIIWTFAGWQWLRVALPAVAFLWFAMPLPERAQEMLSTPLQRQATAGSAWILQSLGQPAAAAGTTLLMGNDVFEVERACSGLRMFFGSLAMAVAFLLLTPMVRWAKLVLLAMVPMIALLANVIRIVLTVLLFQPASTEIGRRVVHDVAGLMMVGIVCVLFALAVWIMNRGHRAYARDRERFLRRLPILPIAGALVLFSLVVWHQRQQARVYGALLEAAGRYEARKDWGTAAGYLRSYLRINPDDASAYARFARVFKQAARETAEKRRALTIMTAAWKANPDNLDLAREQADLALELRRFEQVIDTTGDLLKHPQIERPEYAETRRLAARWRATAMYDVLTSSDSFAPFSWNEVADALREACRWDASFPQHSLRLAIVLRERLRFPGEADRIKQADRALDELVAVNPDLAEAWLAHYLYRQRFLNRNQATPEELAAMDDDLQQAIRLDEANESRNVHILVAAAERDRARGDLDASLTYYQEALIANPVDVRPYLAISEIQVERGGTSGRDEAVDLLKRGLRAIGKNEIPLVFPLVEHLVILDREEEANDYQVLAEHRLELYPEPARTNYRIQLQQILAWRAAREGDYLAAAELLVSLLKSLPTGYLQAEPAYAAQTWATAGQYRRMADDWDGAVKMYEQAAALDDAWALEYRWTAAKRTELKGDFDQASRQYLDLASGSEGTLEAWLSATYAELRQQLLLPSSLRDWTRFRRSLDSARDMAGDQLEHVVLLEANYYLVMGQPDRVVRMLEEGCDQYPESALLHRALALVLVRRGEPDRALQVVDRMTSFLGDDVSSLLLRLEILTMVDRREEALKLLDQAIADRDRPNMELLLESARLHMQMGSWQQARTRLTAAAAQDESDLRVAELMSQLAWCLQDWDLLETCEAMLRSAEGEVGPLWRTFRIRRLLAQSKENADDKAPDVSEVTELTQQLEVLYPRSPETQIAIGRVATFRGLLWQAVANYEEAWELGLPNVPLAVDLISLLNELGEVDRAQKYVGEIRQYLMARASLIDESLLSSGDESAESAIRLAEALVQENPRSETYLRLGRTLVLTAIPDRPDFAARMRRAEHAFRKAAETSPSDPRTWAALFRYMVSVKADLPEAYRVLKTLADHPEISDLNRTFTLAQLHESIGNHGEAEPLYRLALTIAEEDASASDRLVVLERASQYFRRRDSALAEGCCRIALEIDQRAIGARRILLELLLEKATVAANQNARALIGDSESRWVEGDHRLRIQAKTRLQAVRLRAKPRDAHWREAVSLLGQVSTRTSEDALMLAELYLVRQQLGDAIAELQRVADELPQDTNMMLEFLGRWDRTLFSDTRLRLFAERIYDRLEEVPSAALASLDLRVEMLLQRTGGGGSYAEGDAVDRSKPTASLGEQQSAAISLIARFARRAVARASNETRQREAMVELMRHLVETNRWEEAERLTKLTPDLLDPPAAATALATSLSMIPMAPEQRKAFREQLMTWRSRYSQDAPLVFAIANLHLLAGEYEEAADAYRRCHELAPNHAMTLNNLALTRLVQDPEALDEAQVLVETALSLQGVQPQVVDTLGLIQLRRGQAQEAVQRWLEVLPAAGGDPVLLLHLADGWFQLEQYEMAQFALRLAISRGLAQIPLLPFDRDLYQRLQENEEIATIQ